jgi:hypothetical protein
MRANPSLPVLALNDHQLIRRQADVRPGQILLSPLPPALTLLRRSGR